MYIKVTVFNIYVFDYDPLMSENITTFPYNFYSYANLFHGNLMLEKLCEVQVKKIAVTLVQSQL